MSDIVERLDEAAHYESSPFAAVLAEDAKSEILSLRERLAAAEQKVENLEADAINDLGRHKAIKVDHANLSSSLARMRGALERLEKQIAADVAHLEDMEARGNLTKDWGECSLLIQRRIRDELQTVLAALPAPAPQTSLEQSTEDS